MGGIKRFLIILVIFDNFISASLKRIFPTRHKIGGACRQCGNCCREIRLKISPGYLTSKYFTDLVVRWISWLFDFYLLEVDFENLELVFGCRNLSENGRCNNYFWRPSVCRNYPLLDYFKKPVFLPRCGFRSS